MDSEHVANGDPSRLPNRLFYVQAIIRNRLSKSGFYYPAQGALPLLADAWRGGVPIELLESISKSVDVRTWTNFCDAVYDAWKKVTELSGPDSSPPITN